MADPTFTYGADPASSPADALRLTLGDTNADSPLLYDGEIAFFLANAKGNVKEAAYQACGAIIGKLAPLCDERVGEVSLSLSQKYKGFMGLQDTLRSDTGTGAKFYCGGISRTQVQAARLNPDRVAPQVPEEQTDPRYGPRWGRRYSDSPLINR